jgi:hypothetical protein
MTATLENEVDVTEVSATEVEAQNDDKANKNRDFTKFRPAHQELADFVNANSGLDPVTPNQIKAILALRTDFANSPEVKAAREERKAKAAEEKAKFAGLTQEEIKSERAARRAEAQAAKLQARVAEALAKAQALRENKDATGEDIAAAVEAEVADSDEKKRRIRR